MSVWKTVAKLDGAVEADLVRMRLEQAGLSPMVRDQHLSRMDPLLGRVIGSVRVDVPEDQVQDALELLGDLGVDATSTTERPAQSCPSCGSTDVVSVEPSRGKRVAAAFLSFLAGAGGVPRRVADSYRCRQCGLPVTQADE